MTNRSFSPLCAALVATLVIGCGGSSGGGKGGSGGTGGASLVITTSKSAVDYGDTLTVAWEGKSLDSMSTDQSQTNFSIGWKQFKGSFVDQPAADVTYQVVGFPLLGDGILAKANVRVTKSSKSFLVVASAVDPLAGQAISALKTITDGTVTSSASLPNSISADVVILMPSATVGVVDQPKVNNFLASGGRVAFVADAATKLANGHTSDFNSDLTSISTILAGGTKCFFGTSASVSIKNPGIPLSAIYLGDPMPNSLTVNPVTNAIVLSDDTVGGAFAFVFKSSSGGRTAFLGSLSFSGTIASSSTAGVFLAEARWLADGR